MRLLLLLVKVIVSCMLLDLSAGFDTIDHDNLLCIIEKHIGICRNALKLIKSYFIIVHTVFKLFCQILLILFMVFLMTFKILFVVIANERNFEVSKDWLSYLC